MTIKDNFKAMVGRKVVKTIMPIALLIIIIIIVVVMR